MAPIINRVANVVVRGIVKLVNDSTKLQLLQVAGLQVTVDSQVVTEEAEHMQPYGLYAVPLAGAEEVTIYPNGDGGHPIVIAVADRRYRPTGGDPGETGLYNTSTARVRLLPNGDVEVQPGAGGQVFIRSSGGSAEALVKRSEFNAHVHAPGATQAAGGDPVTGNTAAPSAVTGTTKLRAE